MCGLLGMAGRGITLEDRKFFKQLLHCSALRGTDGTGLYTADIPYGGGKPKGKLQKYPSSSPVFIWKDKQEKVHQLESGLVDLFLGHVRDATVGDLTKENTHPFDVGDLIGAHNGTLVDYDFYHREKTDSEMMFERMETEGIRDTLRNLSYYSAYAVSIFDKKKKLLYLARNERRPLHVMFHTKRSVMYWASEEWMLSGIAGRPGMNMEVTDVFYLSPHKIYEISFDKIKSGNIAPWEIIDVNPVNTEAKPGKVKSYGGFTGGYDQMWENSDLPFDQEKKEKIVYDQEFCSVCCDPIDEKELKEIVPIEVDGEKYYCCKKCETSISQQAEASGKRIGVATN